MDSNLYLNQKRSEKGYSNRLLFWSLGLVLTFWLINFAVPLFWLPLDDVGALGDTFGIVNALFSGFAFVGLVYAILLQRNELELQRNELRYTRIELQGQREQLEIQNQNSRKQMFENTFFSLLRLHIDTVNSIDLEVGVDGSATRGRDCFFTFNHEFRRVAERTIFRNNGIDIPDRLSESYLEFYVKYESDLGHYFRTLYNIVKFVHRSDVEDKRFYTNLIRAQLSSSELLLLFYNGLSDLGKEKFKPLIEEYALLKTIPVAELVNPADHMALYASSAFGPTRHL